MVKNLKSKCFSFIEKFYMGIIFIFLYAPIVTLIVLSFNDTKSRAIWGGFTLKWYKSLFNDPSLMSALYTTLIIATLAAIISTVIGTLAAFGIHHSKKSFKSLMMNITYIPVLNPDIVTGIALMLFFLLIGMHFGFLTILLAHITFCIPYVILSVLPKLKQLNKHTFEAALDLGAKPIHAFFKVIVPEILPGIITGFLLAFTLSLDDFVITYFVKGAGVDTLAVKIYAQVRLGIKPEIYALSSLMMVSVLLLLLIVNKRTKVKQAKYQ
ncbi:spermidine/putrescine transport system permease protein [Natranaerovirga pectinivora]|uniref:Spermidine/putrescine transport system permease protein n=1 Tax=Natranaerovirga pectinivora TaxID=682400 RepID=A0A4R3MK19_9FIRM|nr:spermidine/putrescine transport system permease protein [Natranaerovirga pectinivora]